MSSASSTVEQPPEQGAVTLLPQVTCPHCWEKFPPESILWITEHVELIGDPRLGADHQRRFLPSRFTPAGDAIDPKGMVSTRLACPKCHLPVPRALLEQEPLFASILGEQSSGKSYFLAAMTWQLRTVLASQFASAFTDADAGMNRKLNQYEESLFLNPTPDRVVPLNDLIEKTQSVVGAADLYHSVRFGPQTIAYTKPYLFTLRPQSHHPNAMKRAGLSRVLCLYDNAGEHFRPDADTTSTPVTRHLARSQLLFFTLDLTQDPRVRERCRNRERAGSASVGGLSRQETILNEAASRVRRFASLSSTAKHDRPLIVVLTKSDEWDHLLDAPDVPEPWVPCREDLCALKMAEVEQRSLAIRQLMLRYCPEIVSAGEDFCSNVTYVAVSALGGAIEVDPKTSYMGIRPAQIRPRWVTIPLIYGLARVLPGLIPRARAAE